MWAEKLSKQWTPCITTSLRLWDQFLLEHIVHRLNIEGFTRHNKQYIIEGTSEDQWVTPVEWRCDMLWRGGAVTVTEGDAQATLWLQSLVCDYILDTQHDRQQSPISAHVSFKQPLFKPLEVLYLRTVTLRSNSSLKTIPYQKPYQIPCVLMHTWRIKCVLMMFRHGWSNKCLEWNKILV